MQPRKIALVVAIAAIVAVLAFAFGEPTPPVGSAPKADARTTPVAAVNANTPGDGDAQRQSIAAAPEPDADALAHPFTFELEVTLRDRDGLPVAGKQVLLGPELCSLVPMQGTGPDGITRAQWRGKTDRMDVVLCDGYESPLRRIVVCAGSTRRCVLEGPERAPGSPQGWTEGLHPFARFVDDIAGKWQDNSEAIRGGTAIGAGVGHFSLGTRREPPPTILEGTVYGDRGVPVPRVTVCMGRIVDIPWLRTKSDERGCFRLVLPGKNDTYELRAGGGDAGLARARIDVVAEQVTRWDAHLMRESAIRGRAIDDKDLPLTGWTVEVEGTEMPWFDACTVHDDGTFILPNQPRGPHTVLLRSSDRNRQLPVATVSPVQPDGDELLLRYDAAATAGQLRIEPELPQWVQGFFGSDRNTLCEVRVWQEATGRGTSMGSATGTPGQSLGGLPAGWYRVEVGAIQFGWHDLGRHFVDGRSTVDLGRFALPEPGRLRIAHPRGSVSQGDAIEQQICERRADCDVHVAPQELAKGTDLTLPAGDYWLFWRDVRGAQHVRAFAMRSGAETWIDSAAGDGTK